MNPASRNNNSQVTYIWHHLPSREGKKNLRSRSREATATVWLSPGAFGTAYIISLYSISVNILLNFLSFSTQKKAEEAYRGESLGYASSFQIIKTLLGILAQQEAVHGKKCYLLLMIFVSSTGSTIVSPL